MEQLPVDLPAVLPIFPLRGVLLLPGGRLPLNIFEPRYLALVTDALGAGRLIGMVQSSEHPPGNGDTPDLYQIGCVGRIVQFEEVPDGRFLITLLGISRFRLGTERPGDQGYRRFQVDWSAFGTDRDPATVTLPPAGRRAFISTACRYLERQGMQFEQDAIADAPLDRLGTAIAMICPFLPEEKQALLETPDAATRIDMLLALMEMALYQSAEIGTRPQFN